MNLAIISLMSGSPWGGSEELWFQVANHSVDSGDALSISIKKWPEQVEQIKLLKKKNVKIFERVKIKNSIYRRVAQKLSVNTIANNDWDFLTHRNFHHVLLSFGGAYDILNHLDLCEILQQQQINYSIIQQYNEENIFLNDNERNIAKAIFQKAKNVFFVSERNKITTERNLICDLKSAKIVSNPALNFGDHKRISSFPQSSKLKFACVARFDVGIKNQDLLIQSFASKEWENREFQLNLYGKGNGINYLRDLINYYQLNDKIKIRGHISDITEVWNENHIMILVSSAEGSPLSIIEAMYCSRPIIATNVGGNQELIDHTCGFIVPGVNIQSINETLEHVWNNKTKLKKMGNNALIKIKSIHNEKSYLEVYQLISQF
jgi:glycosyltransferase involved in cell wall biosynthesis